MLQGHGGGHAHAVTQGLELLAQVAQVGSPDVAAIDKAGGEVGCLGELGDALQVGVVQSQRAHGKVDLGGLRLELGNGVEARVEGTIRRGEVDLRALLGTEDAAVSGLEGGGEGGVVSRGEVSNQGRFCHLDPLHVGVVKRGQHGEVGLHQLVEAVERLLRSALGLLGEGQQGHRTHKDRAHGVASGAGFLHDLEHALRAGGEGLAVGDLRDDVVVVGVEPLGHLQRRGVLVATCQGELVIEALALDRTHGQRGLEDVVVVGDVRRDGVILSEAQLLEASIGIEA